MIIITQIQIQIHMQKSQPRAFALAHRRLCEAHQFTSLHFGHLGGGFPKPRSTQIKNFEHIQETNCSDCGWNLCRCNGATPVSSSAHVCFKPFRFHRNLHSNCTNLHRYFVGAKSRSEQREPGAEKPQLCTQ